MIELTKLNGKKFVLNALHIEHMEEKPDTIIMLTNGRKYIVQESTEDVMRLAKSFFQQTSLRTMACSQKGNEEDEG